MPDDAPPWYRYAAKAVTAFAALALVALGSLVVSLQDDSPGGSSITTTEWVRLAIAVFGAIAGPAAVYAVPNDYGRPAPRPVLAVPAAPTRRPEHLGQVPPLPPDRDTRPWQ
jgi:hypothetical protein